MNIQKTRPQTTRNAASPQASLFQTSRRFFLLGILAITFALVRPAQAGLISTTLEGPASAPYSYNLTIQFLNGNYYDFILRSTQATITGENLINTVASLTPGMTVSQSMFSFGDAVNGITIGSDTNTGFTNNSFWSYWNGTATKPVVWTSSQTGETATTLTSGQADGWVYGSGSTQPQETAFAVPEPKTWSCLAWPLAALLLCRRVRRACGGAMAGA